MNNQYIDLIVRIKNGYLARKELVEAKYSKMNLAILKKLKEYNFILNYQEQMKGKQKIIEIQLNYQNDQKNFTDIQIYSKPGRRWYISYRDLKPVMGGIGIAILSTPKGILTNKEAEKLKVGGELLFSIW